MEARLPSHLDRLDRHVERSYLRIGDGVSRHRIAYSLEEALRLVVLPGEEEGRIYCFRRVSLPGIPEHGSRQLWMDRVQQALSAAAAGAVHGRLPHAELAGAVYFHHREEALETLLRKAIRAPGAAKPGWFAASLLGTASSSYAGQIPAILERLRQPPLSASAAAAIVLDALGDGDPAALLDAVPAQLARGWVRELESSRSGSADAPPVQLHGATGTMLQAAARHLGWKDPRVFWLAGQVVTGVSPSSMANGTVAERVRATLRLLEMGEPAKSADRRIWNDARVAETASRKLLFDDDDEIPSTSSAVSLTPSGEVTRPPVMPPLSIEARESIAVNGRADISAEATVPPALAASRALDVSGRISPSPSLLGEPTAAAGLYFLLNVLSRLGISAALEVCPALQESRFAGHILKQLAADAGVVDDPILLCLHPGQPEFSLSPEILSALPSNPEEWLAMWPSNLPPRKRVLGSRLLLRTWTVATKLWCWRTARLTIRDLVKRQGHVWLTRTDLDVTMPLASADVRVRRAGLDIDPGWLPWFDEFGRVVRFHYRDRDPGRQTC